MNSELRFEIFVGNGRSKVLQIDPEFIGDDENEAQAVFFLLKERFKPEDGFEVLAFYVQNGIREPAFT